MMDTDLNTPDDAPRMAMGTPDAIARDPARGIGADPVILSEDPREPSGAGNAFLATIKSAGIPQDVLSEALHYAEHGSDSESELATLDAADQDSGALELRSLWGDKFGANVEAINRLLDTLPEAQAAGIRDARRADGRALMNDPAILQRLLGVARGAGGNIPSGDDKATIAAAEKLMRTNPSAYRKDEVLQARLRAAYARQEAKA